MRIRPVILVVESIYFLVKVGKIDFFLGFRIHSYDVGSRFRLPGGERNRRFPTSPRSKRGDSPEEFFVLIFVLALGLSLRVRRYVNHTAAFFWITQLLALPFGWIGIPSSRGGSGLLKR